MARRRLNCNTQKPSFSGLKGQQKRSAGPCFSMLKQNIAGESPKQGGGPRRIREVATRVAGLDGSRSVEEQKNRNEDIFRVQQGVQAGPRRVLGGFQGVGRPGVRRGDPQRGPRRSQKRSQKGPGPARQGGPPQETPKHAIVRADALGVRRSQSLPSRLPGGFTLPHRSVETLGRGPRSKPRV